MFLVGTETPENPVTIAQRNYRNIKTYQVTLRSKSHNSFEEVRYYYKSGCVRMEFIKPVPGAVLTYDPVKKKVRLRPFRFTDQVMTLSPDNSMVQSSAGHSVDESDIGSLLGIVARLKSNGMTYIMGTPRRPADDTQHRSLSPDFLHPCKRIR